MDDDDDGRSNSSATMYMQEALEMVCRRRRLQPKEYALLLSDMSILIPLDRTVASLQGESDLRLVKRSMLPHMNVDVRPIGRSTDPNGAQPSLPSPSLRFSLTVFIFIFIGRRYLNSVDLQAYV